MMVSFCWDRARKAYIRCDQQMKGTFSMTMLQTRRRFLSTFAMGGAAGLLPGPSASAAEGTLETASVRFVKNPAICVAPQYYSQELLRTEGFSEISYVKATDANAVVETIARGRADFTLAFGVNHIQWIDAGAPIVVLAGVHVGCYELFAVEGIRSITELKGKSVGLETASPALLKLMAANVGLDPEHDIRWVTDPSVKPLDLFTEGKIEAFLGFPPEPQELRARRAGHVILATAVDRPWSQYFCCMLAGNRDYVQKYPVATKRMLRAVLKAADVCVTDPPAVARRLVDGGFTPRYDYALQTLSDASYDKWRDFDAEDTIRFYALRLHEAGMIKSTPQKIIAENTNWRFFDELKRELKA
jgi:NitT/TauT family transport system substrate-binding protein